jgi:hypothetical protein
MRIRGPLPREKHLGYAADHCRVCRKILPFEIIEERIAYHVCFIPIERGHFVRNARICQGCSSVSDCHLGQYKRLCRTANGPLDALIAQTHPNISESYREELALGESLAAGAGCADPQVRLRLIREAFGLAEPDFKSGYGHQGRRILHLMLRPLSPTEEEIRAGLQPYRNAYNSRMGAILRVEEVMLTIYPEREVKDPNKFSY